MHPEYNYNFDKGFLVDSMFLETRKKRGGLHVGVTPAEASFNQQFRSPSLFSITHLCFPGHSLCHSLSCHSCPLVSEH